MTSSAGIITVKFAIPDGGKEIRLNFVPNNNIPNTNTTWKIDFGDGNGYNSNSPDPIKTYTNDTGSEIEKEIKFQITSGAMRAIQIHADSIGYLTELTVGNSTLVKNGTPYETLDLSWGLNAVFTGDPSSETGTLLDTNYNVTTLYDATTPIGFFQNATRLTTVPGHLISGITNLSNLFNGASVFNSDISGWNVSNVTDMSYMFSNASAFNQNIGIWDTSKVENMTHMFNEAIVFNQSIGNWNVSQVTDMSYMFSTSNTLAFNQNIGNWDTSKVENMSYMFNSARSFNQNINTKQVTVNETTYTAWDTSNVKNMSYMFSSTLVFDQDIGNWNTSSVTNMSYMFNASSYNQYIGNWDTSSVENMSYMFYNSDFNQNISYWNVNQYKPDGVTLTNLTNMFGDESVIDENNIYGFSVPTPTYDQFNQPFKPATKSDLQGALSSWYTKANNSSDSNAVNTANNYTGSGNGSNYFGNPNTWNVTAVTDMSELFKDKTQLNHPDISTWNVYQVRDMDSMFAGATNFNQNISGWKLKDGNVVLTNMFSSSGITTQTYNGTNSIGKLYGFTVPTPSYNEFNQDIMLNGYNPIAIERGTTYSDEGAVTASGVILTPTPNQVNTSVAGTYSVSYSGTKGDQTVTRTRTVEVVDTTSPVITSNLVTSIDDGETSLGSVSADETVSWSVNNDDDVQVDDNGNVTLKQAANYQTKQTYTYTITATDPSKNSTTTGTITVNVVDTTAPVITVTGDNPATVEKGSTYTDAGASADGGETVRTNGTVNTDVVGSYTVRYRVTDAAGNTTTATRTVNVVETNVVDNNVVVELSSNAFIYNSSENATIDDKLDFTKSVFQSLYNDVSQPGKAIKVESTEGGIILPGISEEPIMKPIFLYDGSSKTEFTEEEVQDKNIYILTESGQTIKIGTTIITQNSSNFSVTINGVTTTKERGSTFVVGTETFILGSIYIESVVINSNSCACISQSDPLNNAILDDVSASPSKDSTSDGGNSFSILRNAFRRTYYPVQPAKKEIYGDKDASVIVRQRTINETSRTLNAVGLPMSFTNGNDSNLVRRSVQRTRNSGGVPNKVAKRGPFQ